MELNPQSGVLVLIFVSVAMADDCCIINTTSGPIRGKKVDDLNAVYYSYQGIPYAEAPTGSLRFKAPVPITPWKEVLNVTKEGHSCPQLEGKVTRDKMSENCLYLNVYVPMTAEEPTPVLVHVHGGEFTMLSGDADFMYGPQLLSMHDIIVVTLNYRLGALGFLSLNIEEAPGNAGLKDILLALKWIKNNIARFGGNENKITLSGNSAGAVAAHYLLLSNQTTGLINQAIFITGSATGFRFLAQNPKEDAHRLANELGISFNSNDPLDLYNKIIHVDAYDIVSAQVSMGSADTRKGFRPYAPFVPVAEIPSDNAIVTEDPKTIVKKGIPQNIPILAGFNSQEGLKMYPTVIKNTTLIDLLNEDFQRCIPTDIQYEEGSAESIELASAIREFYFDGNNITNETLDNFINMITDSMFAYSIDSWIKSHVEREDSKDVYYYEFSFDGELNWAKIVNNISLPGTAHTDELGYIFVTNATRPKLEYIDTRSARILYVMTTLITNFVKFGNPTPDTNNDMIPPWPPTSVDRHRFFIDDDIEFIESPPLKDRLQFWYQVYERYSESRHA